MTAPARATVLIPTRNEEADLAGCIACVRAQDVGAAALEVIVVDGMSTDATVSLVRAAAATAGFARFSLIANPDVRTAAGLTRALGEVTTPIVVRVDARSRIPPGYVRVVCDTLDRRPEVGVVGGAQVPVDGGAGTVPSGIARALSNRYTTGLSRYRRRVGSGITDTVWMGAFRTDELRALGGWDRDHGINEDYELNQRYRDDGRLVWFEATLRSGYVPRRDLASLARQYRAYGRSKGLAWAGGARPAGRQAVLVAVPPLAALAGAWLLRRTGAAATAAVTLAGLLMVDEIGSRSGGATASVRMASAASTATFVAAWWTGVVEGWFTTGPPRRKRGGDTNGDVP